ncbi:hypothetical protein SAMN05421813_103180 [Daejeonella rubra]|uniref:Uncharacterized protein n=1 Tax=Daejeonella rubra TaxID=990371 RepID=A0A1G9NTQ3_9SPHI|nr:hypothetical protein SAMN05421813_103180 [Daejeonella rubra]
MTFKIHIKNIIVEKTTKGNSSRNSLGSMISANIIRN